MYICYCIITENPHEGGRKRGIMNVQLWEVPESSFATLDAIGSVPWPQHSSKPGFPPAAQGTSWFLMLGGFSNSLMVQVS